MRDLLLALPALACPVSMGLMAWWMARSGRRRSPDERDDELARLRKEVDDLHHRHGADQE